MAKKASSRRTRVRTFSPELPSDWSPYSITNPRTGFVFDDDSAWMLIAQELIEGQQVQSTILTKPKDKIAIEMLHDLDPNKPFIYMKVHMGARDKVVGRSFHWSTRGREPWIRD